MTDSEQAGVDPEQAAADAKQAGCERARMFAAELLPGGDPSAWFDAFYQDAAGDAERIPWADREGHPMLIDWLRTSQVRGTGRRALVVGCGLGEDAALLERAGFAVTAFDVSPTAVEWCPRIWPDAHIDFRTANLFDPPAAWARAFDLVVEIYTLQALPLEPRSQAVERIAEFVAPGGELLVVTRGRAPEEVLQDQLPWPLLRADLDLLETHGLVCERFEEKLEADALSMRRWRALYRRPPEE